MNVTECGNCREKIDGVIPYFRLKPVGFTIFLKHYERGPWYFCSYDCLKKWAEGRSKQYQT